MSALKKDYEIWLTMNDIKEILGVSKATIYRWINEGKFPAAVKFSSGGSSRWLLKDIGVNPVRHLRDQEVANRFSVSKGTIWRWASIGQFPSPIKLSDGITRWPVDVVDEWERVKKSTQGR